MQEGSFRCLALMKFRGREGGGSRFVFRITGFLKISLVTNTKIMCVLHNLYVVNNIDLKCTA